MSETYSKSVGKAPYRFSVAPMMDWTDRHCRLFHRQFTQKGLLYTEMITATALVHGRAERLLAHHPAEHPLALQIGGADPALLARAVSVARGYGFDEINLNVGCPSDRVQSGCFGAALMRMPDLVGECVAAMIAASDGIPVTVKTRIGVDDQDPSFALPRLIEAVKDAGCRRIAVHARKAWLKGLSPRENRTIPPLDHDLVAATKAAFPEMTIVINGGIGDLDAATFWLGRGLDGVMIGRAAYAAPALLGSVDRRIFAEADEDVLPEAAVRGMLPYIESERAAGTPLSAITRHMLGAFAGRPGARAWRRMLSEEAHKPGAGPDLAERALAAVAPVAAAA